MSGKMDGGHLEENQKASEEEDEEEDMVISEVHLGCPPHTSGPHISRFSISTPPEIEYNRLCYLFKDKIVAWYQTISQDEDGDLLVPRHPNRSNEILENCARNVHLNSGVLNYRGAIHICELDWMSSWPPTVCTGTLASKECCRYSWSSSEVEEILDASVLLATDVIYRHDLTDACFSILERLFSLGQEKVLYLAMEKRYNFSLDDLEVVANGYSRFRSYLEDGECEGIQHGSFTFVGKCMDLALIPQYVREYNRGYDVELW